MSSKVVNSEGKGFKKSRREESNATEGINNNNNNNNNKTNKVEVKTKPTKGLKHSMHEIASTAVNVNTQFMHVPTQNGPNMAPFNSHMFPYTPYPVIDYSKNMYCHTMTSLSQDQLLIPQPMPMPMAINNSNPADNTYWHYNPSGAVFSRKVFVGGLPIDIDIGYVFLVFEYEWCVQALVSQCYKEADDKYYMCLSSPTMKDKPCQVRPWRLADGDFVLDVGLPLDPRKTVFIGGVPRPLKAVELATVMDNLYGGVCYAGIDTDPELKYPKGAGRVSFNSQQSFVAAITGRFVQLQHIEMEKRVEVRPYVLDDQMCDECQGQKCAGRYAPYFCVNVACLQYYCETCWPTIHNTESRKDHKPLVKETASDKPMSSPCSAPPQITQPKHWSPARHFGNNKY